MDAENLNIEIASDSYAVFFGSYNGGSNGLGTLQAFGDLRPGNSPASVQFGGNLELGTSTTTFIELGGDQIGDFDQLLIQGDLNLSGALEVSLIDDFRLGAQQEFLIADVVGLRNGFFNGFGEGDRVGNFGGFDLFISYRAGTGNDISLFTSVPEPGTAGLMGLLGIAMTLGRRRRFAATTYIADRVFASRCSTLKPEGLAINKTRSRRPHPDWPRIGRG